MIVFILTSTFLSFKAFPDLTKKGIPSHPSEIILSTTAANGGKMNQAEDLQQVVLHHITNNPELIKVSTMSLGTKWFLEGDGDIGNLCFMKAQRACCQI